VSKLSDVENVETVEAGEATRNGYYDRKISDRKISRNSSTSISGVDPWGAANLFAVKIPRSHSFRYAEIPGSLNGIIESKKSAEWWDVISDENREWTDGPKHQES
jgi:hypothetical protein